MERLLSPAELAKLTGLKVSYLYHLTHYKRIPFLKLGSTVKFKISEVEKWLAGCEIQTGLQAYPHRQAKAPKSNSPRIRIKNNHARMIAEKVKKEVLGHA